MFVLWHGFGFLVAVFYWVALIATAGLCALFGINDVADGRVVAISFLLAAAPCWLVGRRLLHRTVLARTATGDVVRVVQPHHALFFIPMHWWGIIFLTLGIIASAFNFGGRLVLRQSAEWITFSPPAADFTVSTPAVLVDTPQTIPSSFGSMQRHRYHANWHGSYFAVERIDYPADFHFPDPHARLRCRERRCTEYYSWSASRRVRCCPRSLDGTSAKDFYRRRSAD